MGWFKPPHPIIIYIYIYVASNLLAPLQLGISTNVCCVSGAKACVVLKGVAMFPPSKKSKKAVPLFQQLDVSLHKHTFISGDFLKKRWKVI